MAAGGLIELAIEGFMFAVEILISKDSTFKEKLGCFAWMVLAIVIIGGLIWYFNTGDQTPIQETTKKVI